MIPGGDVHRVDAAAVVVAAGQLRRRIAAAAARPDAVTVVAVTKGFGRDAVDAALSAGLEDIGENYAGELLGKARDGHAAGAPTSGVPRWHYLGAIQRRRVRQLAPVVSCWHTVCRLVEGQEIAVRAPGATVLVQVDTTGSAARNGCAPGATLELVDQLRLLPLQVVGLMTVAPPGPPDAAVEGFGQVASLAREAGLSELSMGMSGDLEVALQAGATMLRVGRALFGERQ